MSNQQKLRIMYEKAIKHFFRGEPYHDDFASVSVVSQNKRVYLGKKGCPSRIVRLLYDKPGNFVFRLTEFITDQLRELGVDVYVDNNGTIQSRFNKMCCDDDDARDFYYDKSLNLITNVCSKGASSKEIFEKIKRKVRAAARKDFMHEKIPYRF